MSLINYTSSALFWTYFKLFHRLKVKNGKNLPTGGAIIVANHASFLDPPVLAAILSHKAAFLARESLFKHPLFSILLKMLNAYPLKRGEGDLAAFKLMISLLNTGRQVVLFPEGTRSNDGKLQTFQTGAARLSLRSGLPIIPIKIEGAFEALPKGKKVPKLFSPITCTILVPLHPDEFLSQPKNKRGEIMTDSLKDRFDS